MMMLIHRICIAFNGFSKWKMVEAAINDRAATDLKGRMYWKRNTAFTGKLRDARKKIGEVSSAVF